jgi:formylglycine-generating enzyme required for sulfatase activity
MNGNVFQWVQDCFANSYDALPADGTAYEVDAPLQLTGDLAVMNGTDSCSYRMARGGGWGDFPALIRSAARNWAPPHDGPLLATYRSSGFGFRAARELD